MAAMDIGKMNLLCGILFIMIVAVSSQDSSSTEKKSLPSIKEKAFIAKFHIVIAEKSPVKTLYGVEKYDETKKIASLSTIQQDKGSLVIMNYDQSTFTYVEYVVSTNRATKCQVATMDAALNNDDTSDNFHYFGGWREKSSSAIPHMFSSKNMFSMNKSFVYKGTKTIDGIVADQWSAAMNWKDDKDKFQVDYFFTPVGWQSAHSPDRNKVFPLRIEVTGKKTTDTGMKNIHHYYEYLDFVGYDHLDPSEFEVPGGIACTVIGDEKMPSVPSIPDTISYSREVVDSKGNIDFSYIEYDKKMGLMHIRSMEREVLYDFNSGVYYESKGIGCATRAIDPDKDDNAKMDKYFVKDIGPAEFWLLNKTLVYRGHGHSRQIDAISFGASYDSKPFDMYFANLNWHFSPGFSSMPLSMDRNGKHYNFFEFKPSATSLRTNYLWGACRNYRNRKTIKLTFFTPYYMTEENLITDDNIAHISDAIVKQAMLSPSQVQIPLRSAYYDSQSKSLIVLARLYSPPSPDFMYRQTANIKLKANNVIQKTMTIKGDYDDASIKIKSAKVCEETAASTTFKCRSYDLCTTKDKVYTMTMYATLPTDIGLTTDSSCKHFTRSVDGSNQVTVDGAISNLRDAIAKGFLTVMVSPNGYYSHKLSAVAIDTDKNIKVDKSSQWSKFTMAFSKSSLTNTEKITAKSGADCATKCLEREFYRCKSYKWCYGTNECVLSADYPHKNSSSNNRACFISKRSFISEFQALPFLTMEYTSKNSIPNIVDANDCAEKCINNKEYNCESFDYCTDTKECLLSKTHTYSVPADQMKSVSPKCTHYSKNYLLDFEIATNTALSSSDETRLMTIVVSGPEQCAHFCRTGSEQTCIQFDYCSEKRLCQISTVTTKSLVAHVAKNKCDTYTLTDAQKVVANSKFTGSKDTTYSNGSFGGLAFAMVLVGLCLGAGILFVLHRKGTLSRFTG